MRKWQTVLFLTGILMISQAGMINAEVLTDGEIVEEAYNEEGLLENEIEELGYSENQEDIAGISEELIEDVFHEEELCDDLEEVSISGITATITGCYNSAKGGDIRWSKAIGASGYVLYRLRSADGLKKVATINDTNTLQYIDGEIRENCWGRVYTYYVKPLYGSIEGIKSNEVTLQRLAPMKFTKNVSSAAGQVSLTCACTVSANKALGYEIQYATSTGDLYNQKGSFVKVSLNGRNNLTRTITGLTKGQTYYFRVRGYVNYTHSVTGKTTKTWSQYSDVVHVKTQSDSIRVGDTLFFGSYEQDNNSSDGKEKIEWIILDKSGSKVFLVSKYVLDCKPYQSRFKSVTWETCTLRTWLNDTFLKTAFSTAEQNKIQTTTVITEDNTKYLTEGGNNTRDKVFLLSVREANKYFKDDPDRYMTNYNISVARGCKPTSYAKTQGVWPYQWKNTYDPNFKKYDGNCVWWLRSPGEYNSSTAVVGWTGGTEDDGRQVHQNNLGVRPAIWVNL